MPLDRLNSISIFRRRNRATNMAIVMPLPAIISTYELTWLLYSQMREISIEINTR